MNHATLRFLAVGCLPLLLEACSSGAAAGSAQAPPRARRRRLRGRRATDRADDGSARAHRAVPRRRGAPPGHRDHPAPAIHRGHRRDAGPAALPDRRCSLRGRAAARGSRSARRAESRRALRRLVETTAISRQQYDDAVAAWKQAEAALEVARIDIRYTKCSRRSAAASAAR